MLLKQKPVSPVRDNKDLSGAQHDITQVVQLGSLGANADTTFVSNTLKNRDLYISLWIQQLTLFGHNTAQSSIEFDPFDPS